jgi:hypothetical protein
MGCTSITLRLTSLFFRIDAAGCRGKRNRPKLFGSGLCGIQNKPAAKNSNRNPLLTNTKGKRYDFVSEIHTNREPAHIAHTIVAHHITDSPFFLGIEPMIT